ncbi:MAG: hypothetical protein JWR79_187 [Tardiphaga sp.]|nr:hypothetical protein [Tardiphaga sp.]
MMKVGTMKVGIVAVAASLVASAAAAHVVLDKREAPVGTYFKAVFQVGHGCDGSPTTGLLVRIPDGVIAAKPMVKPGWTIELTKGAYAQEHAHHGHAVSEGVRSIRWTGTLPDEHYDEFAVSMMLTDALKPGTTLYFPVIQTCEQGESQWVDVPETGKPASKTPAPGLALLPKR